MLRFMFPGGVVEVDPRQLDHIGRDGQTVIRRDRDRGHRRTKREADAHVTRVVDEVAKDGGK